MELNEILVVLSGLGLLSLFVFLFNKNPDDTKIFSSEEFEMKKKWEEKKLEKKSDSDIVNSLDNADDISKIKSDSDKEFDNIFDQHSKNME